MSNYTTIARHKEITVLHKNYRIQTTETCRRHSVTIIIIMFHIHFTVFSKLMIFRSYWEHSRSLFSQIGHFSLLFVARAYGVFGSIHFALFTMQLMFVLYSIISTAQWPNVSASSCLLKIPAFEPLITTVFQQLVSVQHCYWTSIENAFWLALGDL